MHLDMVVVGNGWEPSACRTACVRSPAAENLGIPAGRNRGAQQVTGEWIFFLDDDASLPSPSFLADAVAQLDADPSIGLLQPRVVDPEGKANPRRWMPRMRKGDPAHPSNVFSVWEGATLLPRAVFDATGGWGDPYFYAHEGIELAWRVWDQGRRAWYAGDLVANHPGDRADPARRLLPAQRPQPGLAGQAQPALGARAALRRHRGRVVQLLRSIRRPAGLAGMVRRLGGGLAREPRRAPEHQVGNGVADDRGRAATGGVMVHGGWRCRC